MMRRLATPPVLATTAILTLTLITAACGSSAPAGSQAPSASAAPPVASPSTTAAPAASASSSVPSATGQAAGCGTGAWRSVPVSVTRSVAVPPVPVLTGIRAATHPACGYDRLVLDFTGPVPGYRIRYVTHVIADPSGRTITLPGHSYLLITLRPAQAHAGSGAATITPGVHVSGYPALRGYALAGDFEGVVNFALGLQSATSIRVGELPGRLYVDIKT
jgi:hypothetical protein